MRNQSDGSLHILGSYWRRLLIADLVVVLFAASLAWAVSTAPGARSWVRGVYFERGLMTGSERFTFERSIHSEPVPGHDRFRIIRPNAEPTICWFGVKIDRSPPPPRIRVELPDLSQAASIDISSYRPLDSSDWEQFPPHPLRPVDFLELR